MSTTLDDVTFAGQHAVMQGTEQVHHTERVLASWGMPRVVITAAPPASAQQPVPDNVLRFPDGRCIQRGPRSLLVATARMLGLTLAS